MAGGWETREGGAVAIWAAGGWVGVDRAPSQRAAGATGSATEGVPSSPPWRVPQVWDLHDCWQGALAAGVEILLEVGTRQCTGDVGKAAGCGVRGIWEKEGRRPLYLLPVQTGYFTLFILKRRFISLWLKQAQRGKVTLPWTHSDRVGIPTKDWEDLSNPSFNLWA